MAAVKRIKHIVPRHACEQCGAPADMSVWSLATRQVFPMCLRCARRYWPRWRSVREGTRGGPRRRTKAPSNTISFLGSSSSFYTKVYETIGEASGWPY